MGSTPVEIEAALKVVGDESPLQEYTKQLQEKAKSEAPQHKVILMQPIYLGVHEVTQNDYETVMGKNPSHFATMGSGKAVVAGIDTTSHPVENVTWNDAAEFCARLSQQEKLKPFYFRANETVTLLDGTGYRLPTEAEWEFACRAGTMTRYWIGDLDADLLQGGWFVTNSGGRTHAVGELKSNPFGLYDIHGNISEHVQDWWEPTYYGQFQGEPALDPSGPASAGSERVIRGSGWNNKASYSRASCRLALDPTTRFHCYGLRVSLSVDAVRQTLASGNLAGDLDREVVGFGGWGAR